MSRYGWEKGSVVLPAKAARLIRAALAEEHEKARALALIEVQSFLAAKGSGGRSKETFSASLENWRNGRAAELERASRSSGWSSAADDRHRQRIAAEGEAVTQVYSFFYERVHQGQVAKPTGRDLKAEFPPAPKGPKATYRIACASIDVDGTRINWRADGNHGVEEAHEHPMGARLFAELEKVEWTPGTGGEFLGNDEYNEESGRDYAGRGGSYQTFAFGPLGDPHYVTTQQQAKLAEAASRWRARSPANAGRCGQRTMVHGRPTGPPCRNFAGSCPVHGARRVQRSGAYR